MRAWALRQRSRGRRREPRDRAGAMEPPPAPMDSTATMGWRTGRPPSSRSLVTCTSPSRIRHTSVVVPPMSKLNACSTPRFRARPPAAATRAAGPEAARPSGSSRSASGAAMPPRGVERSAAATRDGFAASRWSRYVEASGRTPAQSAVVAERSYSRISGLTRLESATNAIRSRSRSPSASSWAGSA